MSAVILAAGTSSRLGTTKQLLTLKDRSLLQHVIDNARAACLEELIVVLGHDADAIRAALEREGADVRIVVNPRYAEGQSSSLRIGLDSVSPDAGAAVILLGDQPGVDRALIDRVVDAFRNSTRTVARPFHAGAMGAVAEPAPGHPVVIDRCHFEALRLLEGDAGARNWLSDHPEHLLRVEVSTPLPADVDTRADWERMIGERRGETGLDS